MSSLFLGFFGFTLIIASVLKGHVGIYFQIHSILLVLVGTMMILLFSTTNSVLFSLWKALKGLFETDKSITHYQAELKSLSKTKANQSTYPLIKYASELWEQGIDPELFVVLLSQKRAEMEVSGVDAIQALKNLTKYPPALGMIGTVMGMVNLFSALDENKSSIGTHLSMAMTATFLGLVVANGLISPLADRLQAKQAQNDRVLDGIYEILLLVNRGEAAVLIQGEVEHRAA